jgi:hypothetical protein
MAYPEREVTTCRFGAKVVTGIAKLRGVGLLMSRIGSLALVGTAQG